MFKFKNEFAPPIMDSMFERRIEPYHLRNFQEFFTEKKELCIMVLRHLAIGLHNYGLFNQKTLRLSHSKFFRGKLSTGSVNYVNLICRILVFFNHFCCYS